MADENKAPSKSYIIILLSILCVLLFLALISCECYIHKSKFKSSREEAQDLLKKSDNLSSFSKFRSGGGDSVEYTILKKCKDKNQLNESCLIDQIES